LPFAVEDARIALAPRVGPWPRGERCSNFGPGAGTIRGIDARAADMETLVAVNAHSRGKLRIRWPRATYRSGVHARGRRLP